jgi:hypothetical protein
MKPLVSLLTDFGLMDPFVGEMKAVIFSICPSAEIIDITHAVERFDIRAGAFLLASAASCFPTETVHLAVVDPGVGGERRPIAVETQRALYVGPDNGLLIPAAIADGIQHVYHLTNRSFMRDKISSTFHGRDIFAPVAAHLACGAHVEELGVEITDYVKLSFGRSKFEKAQAICEVVHNDKFGNVVTNIPNGVVGKLSGRLFVRIGGRRFRVRLVRSYSELEGNELGLLVGSHGFLELACRESSAARKLSARPGRVLRIRIG